MKRHTVIVFALIALHGPAQAQDRNEEVLKAIYGKLENVLGISSTAPGTSSRALVLAVPGYVIDKNLSYVDPQQRALFWDLVDGSLQPSWLLRFSPYKTSYVYKQILDYHIIGNIKLTDDEKARLATARKLLYQPGPNNPWSKPYLQWDAARQAYFVGQDNFETWQREHPTQKPPAAMKGRLQQLHDLYFNDPNYSAIVAALDEVTVLGNRDPAVFWGNLRAQYNSNTTPVAGTSAANYDFYPAYGSWLDNSLDWTNIKLSDKDVESFKSSTHSSWGGSVGASWGLWSVGGNYGQSTGSSVSNLDTKRFNLSFDLLRVRVLRPWMDPSVYGARTWDWAPGTTLPSQIISNGDQGASPPDGIEPLVSEEILLARNISLSGNWNTDLATTYHSERSGGGRIGFGPFSFGGSGSSTYDEAKDSNKVTANSITSPGVQIIGVLVHVRPKTPYPDPSLFQTGTYLSLSRASLMAAPIRALAKPSAEDASYNQRYQKVVPTAPYKRKR